MKLLKRFVSWMENGDLIPALLAVSIPHYAHVLQQYDFWPVAASLGFLVDVGHYRTIKLYLKGKGWLWMGVLTLFSAGFHIAFYSLGGAGLFSVVLGLAPTVVIFSLAFITKSERLDKKQPETNQKSHETPTETTHETVIPDYETYLRFNAARNGDGPIPATELIASYRVKKATAYRWYARYVHENSDTQAMK